MATSTYAVTGSPAVAGKKSSDWDGSPVVGQNRMAEIDGKETLVMPGPRARMKSIPTMAPTRSQATAQRQGSTEEGPKDDLLELSEEELKDLLEEEIAKARQRERKRKMIDQIIALRNGAPLESVYEGSARAATPQPEPKRSRIDVFTERLPRIRWKGGSWDDLQDFLFKLNNLFRFAEEELATDESKVLFVGNSLEGSPLRRWIFHVTRHYGGRTQDVTWAEMEAWLKNSVDSGQL
ncbi:hypothetical protein LY76DRAFT_686783 [Colletotrichum caudatum]|nr:hypothetical protein LY76DRAFT_686783 [Colletotrichum caudatum]